VPSRHFSRRPVNSRGRRVFNASTKEGTKDQWSKYRIPREALADEILMVLERLGSK
jgi:hypothetical protein